MKKAVLCLLSLGVVQVQACLNTISNNTKHTYKIVEIQEGNKDMKKQVFLPEEYLKDETKAHTIEPGEEVSFGGHYVPTFMIFKQYPDGKWHSLMVVKQLRCGPRGPENKYLLLTDLLNRTLPHDYKDVYKFTLKKEQGEITDESTNAHDLSKVENSYQVVLNLVDDFTQKLQEALSKLLQHERDQHQHDMMEIDETKEDAIAEQENETPDGAACPMCVG